MPVPIKSVIPGSPADEAGIKAGTVLVSVNGFEINDVLDYMFYADADMGLEFGSFLMDKKRGCKNGCVFCFIDQLPKGLRETLYFKDDDERLSFLQGNYITLTNLSEKDVRRIIKMRISVNVSVHTTNPELRVKMMRNKNAGRALDILYRLAEAGARMNCQLVLCPGINDGAELERSLSDLTALGSVESVACVPAGLTRFRARLPLLRLYDAKGARAVVRAAEKRENVYAADEFYLTAGLPIPEYGYYGDFPQYENGVGMCAYLRRGFAEASAKRGGNAAPPERKKTVVTGVAAFPLIKELAGENANVFAVKNGFFGESVTVSGLLTGGDIIKRLCGEEIGGELLIGANTLNADGLTLDGLSLGDIGKALGVKATAVKVDGEALYKAVFGL